MKHTTSPWFWSGNFLMGKSGEFASSHILGCTDLIQPSPEDKKLIAAAPELLEALIEAKSLLREEAYHNPDYKGTMDKIQAVIKKATT